MQAYTDCMYSPIMKAEVPCTAKNCLSWTQWLVIQVWIWVLWFLLVLFSTWFVYVCVSRSILFFETFLIWQKIKGSSSAFVNVGNRSAVCKYFVLLVASSLNFSLNPVQMWVSLPLKRRRGLSQLMDAPAILQSYSSETGRNKVRLTAC